MKAYTTFKFILGITVAHELVHLFVGLITADPNVPSPPELTFHPEYYNNEFDDGEEEDEMGESGRAWEGEVLGGAIEIYADEGSLLKQRQAGFIMIIDENKIAWEVPYECVKRNAESSK